MKLFIIVNIFTFHVIKILVLKSNTKFLATLIFHPKNAKIWVGASTVKYPTTLPCIRLSESDLKLYTDFDFCEGVMINI